MADKIKNPPIVKLLVVIMDQKRAKELTRVLDTGHILLQYRFRAEGTASSELLDVFGLGKEEKEVAICLVSNTVLSQLLKDISRELGLKGAGMGIAFTMPLSGAAMPVLKLLDDEAHQSINEHIESEGEKMKNEANHSLVLAVINQGYSEEVMEEAKKVGAGGGTVFHARRIGLEEPMKFWGITVHGEKEVIAILASRSNKMEIMKAINSKFGISSEAEGIVLSLPVDGVAGLSQYS